MIRVQITPEADDAGGFINEVQALTDGLLRSFHPAVVIVIKVDNFFGSNWLHFSGKVLGALGVWHKKLNIPPFVPERVVSQRAYSGPTYEEFLVTKPVHVHTESTNALQRFTADIAKGAAIVWYSGGTTRSGQGSMMAHFPTVEGYWPIYVRWADRGEWKVVESHQITAAEVRKMIRTSFRLSDTRPLRQSRTL